MSDKGHGSIRDRGETIADTPRGMTRRRALALSAGALIALSGGVSAAQTSTTPTNILVVVLDDVGFSDIGAYGSEIRTPNIDALAEGGLRYNRFETCSVCSPTRASLLTGRNSHTLRMEDLPSEADKPDPADDTSSKGEMPGNVETLAQALRARGFSTYALGKWHIAPNYKTAPDRNMASWPLQRGFDHYYGFLSGWTDQYNPELVEGNVPVAAPRTPGYHLSVDLVDHAIDALQPSTDGRPQPPKFVYLSLGAAHSPLQVPNSHIDAYNGTYDKGWDVLRDERFARQKKIGIIPANTILPKRNGGEIVWDTLDARQKRVYARFMQTYAGFMTHADEQIGRLVAHLKKTGQYDNTMIVLLSDNGASTGGGLGGGFRKPYNDKTSVVEMDAHLDELGGPKTLPHYQRGWAMAGGTPFRRYKLWPYAGGPRTPLIITWPERIKEHGAVRSQYVNVIDLAPTLLEAVGTAFRPTIDGVDQIPVAGTSIGQTFTSSSAATRSTQYFELRSHRAITDGKWRAVAMHKIDTDYADDRWELFDVENDYAESKDLSKIYPDKLKELQDLWWKEAKKYAHPQVTDPQKYFYETNRFSDAFLD